MPLFTVAFNEITDEEVVDVTLGDVDDRENGRKNRENTKKSPYNGIQELKIVGILGQNYVLGMTVEEYESVDSCLLIAFDKDKRVASF